MVSVNKGEWDISNGIEKDFDFQLKWISKCKEILKPSSSIVISGTYHSIYQCGFALQKLGFRIINDISWYKPNASPNLSCKCFTASHETLIWAVKPEFNKNGKDITKYTFNYELMKNSENLNSAIRSKLSQSNIGLTTNDFIKNDSKQMRSVWSIPTPSSSEKREGRHPTQKPVLLLERLILALTKENDLVIDPFTGSSTTGLAAKIYGRKFIGNDMNKEFLDLSIARHNSLFEGEEND